MIIAGGQVNNALGLKNLPPHENFVAKLMESFKHIGETNMHAFLWFLCNFFPLYILAVKYAKP